MEMAHLRYRVADNVIDRTLRHFPAGNVRERDIESRGCRRGRQQLEPIADQQKDVGPLSREGLGQRHHGSSVAFLMASPNRS